MRIIAVDDELSVRELFHTAISSCGHTAVLFEGPEKVLSHLKQKTEAAEILYLDNHFKGNDRPGISYIQQIRNIRPFMQIVVCTVRDVEPQLVQEIVSHKVGFIHKPTEDGMRLKADIVQRVNELKNRRNFERIKLEKVLQYANRGHEGILRLLPILQSNNDISVDINRIHETGGSIIIPEFKHKFTIRVGETIEFKEEVTDECSEDIKIETKHGLGMTIKESLDLFASKIGAEIRSTIEKKLLQGAKRSVSTKHIVGQTFCITNEEAQQGVRRKDYFFGMLYKIVDIELVVSGTFSSLMPSIHLRAYIPERAELALQVTNYKEKLLINELEDYDQYANHDIDVQLDE